MTRKSTGTTLVKDGYIIPVDGDRPGGRVGTWLRLESLLTEVSRIPARHILVLLDVCHSGLALEPIIKWRTRGGTTGNKEPLEHLRARRSRIIITSALDDQLALDSGPVHEHSLFTGCLIEYNFPDGTRVRMKPNGDITNSTDPMYSVELTHADAPRPGMPQESIAFKYDTQGQPVPKGPSDIQNPYPDGTAAHQAYQDALIKAGHLYARPTASTTGTTPVVPSSPSTTPPSPSGN